MTTKRRSATKAVPSLTGQYVAEYQHDDKVDGNRLQRVNGVDVSEAKGNAERSVPPGFSLTGLYAQCWPNAELDAEEEEEPEAS
jgi:hypothetical protein